MKTFELSAQSGKVQMHYEAEERLTAKQKTALGLAGIWALVISAGAIIFGGLILGMVKDGI